ncbi:MAG: HPr kinase/phosphorylase [Chlamydiales bacterium]|nr:HPr kinase/phosphorylase [Chlamydiales bacterium]MCH9619941.1 HPr kinase/phosphorylase [Chlamydiales bacterium]MCH9622632.1 HPr kinase/phosphorylase [Chlamydiales bacterium]
MKVKKLYKANRETLKFEILTGEQGFDREIKIPEVQRPGLVLSGYLKGYIGSRILVFGKIELFYLKDLSSDERSLRLETILPEEIPAVIVAGSYDPPDELIVLCRTKSIPLICSSLETDFLISRLYHILVEAFAPSITCHGTFVEVHGIGVLMQGDSAIGKSEAALSLIDRGHRLISDDITRVLKKKGGILLGSGLELSKSHIEVRGIGILNVAHLYGIKSIREEKKLDLVVKLEVWDDAHFYDRSGLFDESTEILGVELPFHVMPVKPGRDIALLVETLALNHRLKRQGVDSAKELEAKLVQLMNG